MNKNGQLQKTIMPLSSHAYYYLENPNNSSFMHGTPTTQKFQKVELEILKGQRLYPQKSDDFFPLKYTTKWSNESSYKHKKPKYSSFFFSKPPLHL